jgi:excisionase family DNA binding protein
MIHKSSHVTKQARPVMTISQVADVLGVSYPTAVKWAHDGHLPIIKIGPKTFVLREEFMGMLVRRPGRSAT